MFELETMLTLAAVAAASGVAGGILAGLLGVGGGIVIVPVLEFALSLAGIEPALTMKMAVGTSLATIVFTALSSGYGHYRRGAIDMNLLKLWAPSILVGVFIGGSLAGFVSGNVLKAVFAVVAAAVAVDMIFRKANGGDAEPRSFSKPVWAGFGIFGGTVSSMMGIGGGTVCVPLLNFLGYDIRKAVGTSAAIGFVIGLPGALMFMATGFGREGLPPFSLGYVNLFLAAVIIPLSASFAQVGVKLAHSIPRSSLRLAFGIFLLITSARMASGLI